MRNLKLLKSLQSPDLQGVGSPQWVCVRADSGSLLVTSQFSILEFDPRSGQVRLKPLQPRIHSSYGHTEKKNASLCNICKDMDK